MTQEQFKREKLYQTTIAIVRSMLREGLITDDELKEIDKEMLAKYKPLLGTLYAGNP